MKGGEIMKFSVDKLNLELARKQLSIQEVCKKSGIPRSTLVQVRKGLRNPLPKTIGRIAHALEVDVTSLIEDAATSGETK